ENLFYTVDVTNPDRDDEHVMVKGQVNGLTSASTASVPDNANYEDMAAVMAAGFSVDGNLSHSGAQTEFAVTSRSDNMSGNSSTGSGNFAFTMNADEIAYSVSAMDTQLNMVVPDLPFPVELTMEETGFDFKLPVARTDQPQDFRFAVTLGGFAVPDMIWGMFDPAGQLSHDPATIAFDVTGKVRVLADIFNPEELDDDVPGELHELTINGLTVRAAGAELTGAGAFTFDNSDLVSFDGMPRPEGALNLALTGGNALLDTLVAMGFIPEDQANGTRMMIGMFAVPGDGPDSLASTIEVNEEGHVLANGQRLK
ncbi:MAG: DUF2125 domain-containing protein, partial [Thalassovita sp.]|nr:DUF2125 domain-containing protein [Thalassovita sp.]